jgi:hypothetical protein
MKKTILLDSLLIALVAAVLIMPLFRVDYLNNWSSIESAFIGDGRFLAENWPHPLWQPLWYGGTRFDYVYLPVLRYGTASLIRYFSMLPAHAYHVWTAIFYALGIAGVYLLVRAGSGSRGGAWLAAGAAALISPSFWLMEVYLRDSEHLVPQRLHVLMKYGEGPHISALGILGFALAAALVALRGSRPVMLALAALLSAATVLTNFYGAVALAILFPVLVWSVWVTHLDVRVWARAVAIAVLAYGLAAFWLVPSYLRVTVANLELVGAKGNLWSVWVALGVVAAYVFVTWRFARGRKERTWGVFICGAAVFFALNVLGGHYFGFSVVGNTARWVPELDLALILLVVEGLRRLWVSRRRAVAVAIVVLLAVHARHYVRHAWEIFPADPEYTSRVECRMTDWVARELPGSRVFATGSIRFWYDVWHDLTQSNGGSDPGLSNPDLMPSVWEIRLGSDPKPSVLWLQAFGADAIIVPQKNSQEVYHDFLYPQKFAGVLPMLYDDGAGNIVYRVPRRYPALARVVDRAQVESLGPVRGNGDVARLEPYVDAVENGPATRVAMDWEGTDAIRLHATVAPGQCLLVQATYDPAWRAYAGGRGVLIRRDVLGQMLVCPPPGVEDVQLRFELPFENALGRVMSAAAALILLAYAARFTVPGKRRGGSAASM